MVPGALQYCKNIWADSLDTCEGGRYSCYIGPDMIMVPCSFDQKKIYGILLEGITIEQAWNSTPFGMFRQSLKYSCPECTKQHLCMGGCPLMPEIVLCNKKNQK